MKKQNPVYKTKSLSRLLFEQEDELDELDEEIDELDEEIEDSEEEEASEDKDEVQAAPEEEEKLEVDIDDEIKLASSIDHDIEALFIDFETDARKSAQLDDEAEKFAEGRSLHMLLEQDYDSDIDLERFASEVARLIKNYTSLIDMEKMLTAKARSFIASRYGEEAEKDLVNILDKNHNIEIEQTLSPDTPVVNTPIAVGAASSGGGA